MEGPTPVSALIHAATMVTAGVYMVARCGAIFAASEPAMTVVAVVGGVTAFFAATIAVTQFDMKRILAYSTISQLGYMFLGLGAGAFSSAIFHLFTHAYFKALLFLGAGSVMHAMHGVIDIRRFGGLAAGMRITAWTFWIGGLALAGFPLLSGFWSKDEIVHAALAGPMSWLGYLALATALLTAFYTFRMIFVAFHGPLRLPPGVAHAQESGRWMTVPLMLLAVGAAFAGYFGGSIQRFLASTFPPIGEHAEAIDARTVMLWSAFIAVVGICFAWYVYRRRPAMAFAAAMALGPIHRLVKDKYYVDELYDRLIVWPLRAVGGLCHGVDRFVIDGLLLSISGVPRAIGFGLRTLQRGAMQGYALGMLIGLIAILVWVLAKT